jgi:hypothetical protein
LRAHVGKLGIALERACLTPRASDIAVASAEPGKNVATSRAESRLQVERGGARLASAAKRLLRSTSAVRMVGQTKSLILFSCRSPLRFT